MPRELYHRLDHEAPVAQHQGIFFKQISLFEGIALIVSGTVGAGVLGLPYAIAKVGVGIGLLYIVILGLLMMGFNLLLGKLALSSGAPLQLPGLAERYLGRPGKMAMSAISYSMLFGVLVVYIVGEGQTLAALFSAIGGPASGWGGDSFFWSILFFLAGAALIFIGMETIKTVEMALTFGILGVVLGIVFLSAPHLTMSHLASVNFASLFFPYGVVLFALHGATSVPEAHAILLHRDRTFKKAIVIAGTIVILVYAIFCIAVVGVSGGATTEIATIGLGAALGRSVFILGNLFAVLAMGTSFLMAGSALRDSFVWDFHVPRVLAASIVTIVPLAIFLLGVREFILAINAIGGVLISAEMLLILFVYWKARRTKRLRSL